RPFAPFRFVAAQSPGSSNGGEITKRDRLKENRRNPVTTQQTGQQSTADTVRPDAIHLQLAIADIFSDDLQISDVDVVAEDIEKLGVQIKQKKFKQPHDQHDAEGVGQCAVGYLRPPYIAAEPKEREGNQQITEVLDLYLSAYHRQQADQGTHQGQDDDDPRQKPAHKDRQTGSKNHRFAHAQHSPRYGAYLGVDQAQDRLIHHGGGNDC